KGDRVRRAPRGRAAGGPVLVLRLWYSVCAERVSPGASTAFPNAIEAGARAARSFTTLCPAPAWWPPNKFPGLVAGRKEVMEPIKNLIERAWESLTEGWRELLTRSSGALTHFGTEGGEKK